MNQVFKNICGLIAVFSLGYAGASLKSFVAANRGLSYTQFLAKAGAAAWNFIRYAPWQVKVICGASILATAFALGEFDVY